MDFGAFVFKLTESVFAVLKTAPLFFEIHVSYRRR